MNNLKAAFLEWAEHHPELDKVKVYRALLRERKVPLRVLQRTNREMLDQHIHIHLLGTAMAAAATVAAHHLRNITRSPL